MGESCKIAPIGSLEALRERISRLSEASLRITEDKPIYIFTEPRLGDQMEKGEARGQDAS